MGNACTKLSVSPAKRDTKGAYPEFGDFIEALQASVTCTLSNSQILRKRNVKFSMVNIGVPSRACKTCKERRIKCDQTRPSCQRCRMAGRTCPGVPEDTDILFKNQVFVSSGKSKQKMTGTSRESPAAPSKPMVVSFAPNVTSSPSRSSPESIPHSIPTNQQRTFHALAVSSLFQSFDPSDGTDPFYAQPNLEVIRHVFNNAKPDSPLYLALIANALRAMTSPKESHHLWSTATILYHRALSMCKEAIKDPQQAKDDETLLGSVIMSWYESQTITPASLESYNSHVRGAITLLRHRGASQFDDKQALKVFEAIRWQLVIHCIQRAIPIDLKGPGAFWLDKRANTQDVIGRLYSLAIHIPGLRHRTERLDSIDDSDVAWKEATAVRLKAQDLDKALSTWFERLPPSYQHKTIVVPTEPFVPLKDRPVWQGMMFQYESLYCSRIINNYRIMRLYLQSVISTCLEFSGAELQNDQYDNIESHLSYVIQQQVNDICHTVPFYLGSGKASVKQGKGANWRSYQVQTAKPGSAVVSHIMLPLHICTCIDCVSEEQRDWLRGRMAALTRLGYKQARLLVQCK